MTSVIDRTIELKSKLEEHQIDLRKDSALCSGYINGTLNLTIDNVVRRMCEMKYLYEYCYMKQIKKTLYKEFVSDKKKSNKNIIDGTINSNKNIKDGTINSQAERLALLTWSEGKYPEKFPWENKSHNIIDFLSKIKVYTGLYLLLVLIIPIMYNIVK